MRISNLVLNCSLTKTSCETHLHLKTILHQLSKGVPCSGSLRCVKVDGQWIELWTLQDGRRFYWSKDSQTLKDKRLIAEERMEELLEIVRWK